MCYVCSDYVLVYYQILYKYNNIKYINMIQCVFLRNLEHHCVIKFMLACTISRNDSLEHILNVHQRHTTINDKIERFAQNTREHVFLTIALIVVVVAMNIYLNAHEKTSCQALNDMLFKVSSTRFFHFLKIFLCETF